MDEDFLKHALSQMGEENVISIKVRKVQLPPTSLFNSLYDFMTQLSEHHFVILLCSSLCSPHAGPQAV